jgi:hypothetical protein
MPYYLATVTTRLSLLLHASQVETHSLPLVDNDVPQPVTEIVVPGPEPHVEWILVEGLTAEYLSTILIRERRNGRLSATAARKEIGTYKLSR